MKASIARHFRIYALIFAGMLLGAGLTGTALAVQGRMLAARDHLNAAYAQLNLATADKGGHRVKAMGLVQQAINEVNMGISAGAK